MEEFPLLPEQDGVPLFYPFVPPEALEEVQSTLQSRWIGQGPKVDLFESLLQEYIAPNSSVVATGSGTDSLHLAYLLAGIKEGDEVITPTFTCTATNIPLLYIRAKPIFVDIDLQTFNININDIEHRITAKTKAIVAVDYGGIPCNYAALRAIADKHGLKLIADCAQSIGAMYAGRHVSEYADFVAYSFQAIKTITTGDGGALVINDPVTAEKAKRLRWFGIDRNAKQKGTWENDITEIGYKYQLSDLAASIGIASLKYREKLLRHRIDLLKIYTECINNSRVRVISPFADPQVSPSPWLCTVVAHQCRKELMKYLRDRGVESAQVHYRNDRYSIFGGRRDDLPIMDSVENDYLVLPVHHMLTQSKAREISQMICDFN